MLIVSAVFCALIALSSSSPLLNQQTLGNIQAGLSTYEEVLQSIFPNLIAPLLHAIDKTINQFIQVYRPMLNGRAEGVNVFQFLYENIVADLFGGLASNTANYLQNSLNNLLNKPFGIGKRDLQGDLVARVNALSFLYDNILQDLFSGLVTNTFGTIGNALNNLIQTNPLGIGKRAEGVNIFQFLYENIVADLFGGLASNTANYLQNSLNNLLNKPFGIGKRSIDVFPTVAILTEKIRVFFRQAVSVLHDRPQLTQLIQTLVADIKATVADLAEQLSQIIPSAVTNQVSQVLAGLQSMLIFWTSGLAGSLGPVLPQ